MQFDRDKEKAAVRRMQALLWSVLRKTAALFAAAGNRFGPALAGIRTRLLHIFHSGVLRRSAAKLRRIPLAKSPGRILPRVSLRESASTWRREKKPALTLRKQLVVLTSLAALALMLLIGAAASRRTRLRTGGGEDAIAVQAAPVFPKLSQTGLAQTLPGLLYRTDEAARALYGRVHEDLIAEYMEKLDRGEGSSFVPETGAKRDLWESVRAQRRERLQQDPLLLLVNKWHHLPEDYEADPVELPNGQQIGSVCHSQLMQMLDDCAAAGGTPIVCSGFRPHWYQVNLFNAQINRWLYAGYGQEDAEDLAATAVAIPGTSEHELGLAADIYSTENMDLDESQIYTHTQQWLMQNCWRYGFILRYPLDKSDITGIIFEPWHYRYVGYEHAKKIFDADICLEEYLDETEHPDEAELSG